MLSKRFSACLLAFSLIGFGSVSASAGTYDFGTLTSSHTYADAISKTKFADAITFSAPGNYVRKLALTSASEDVGAEATLRSFTDLNRDERSYDSGQGSGWFGDVPAFSLASVLPSVPEPANIAMLLAGFGLIVTTARRRTAHR